MSSSFGLASFFLSLLAYFPLWARIIHDRSKPVAEREALPKVTWTIWCIVDLGLAVSADEGSIFQMWAYVLGAGSIAVYAFAQDAMRQGGVDTSRYAFVRGLATWSNEDKRILAFAATAFVTWIFVHDFLATGLLVCAALVGALPLCKELRANPSMHGCFAWLLFWLGGVFGLAALFSGSWSWHGALAPLGFFPMQCIILVLALRTRRISTVVHAYQFTPVVAVHKNIEHTVRLAA